jgi:hemerythrin
MIWGAMFEVGVAEIDSQHIQLFNLANELAEAIMQHREEDVLLSIVNGLIRYTQTHFAAEEQLMTLHRYAAADEHRLCHHELAQQVAELKRMTQAGEADAADKALKLFTEWLADHIMHVDKVLASDLKQKGVL